MILVTEPTFDGRLLRHLAERKSGKINYEIKFNLKIKNCLQ